MKDRKPPYPAEPMDTSTRPAPKRGKSEASLGRDVQAKIGAQLRAYYDGLLEPTPDRFANLLRELDKQDGKEPTE
jgi:hypothetical protein